MRLVHRALLFITLSCAALPAKASAGEVIDLGNRKGATFPAMIAQAKGAGEVFIGEAHDNPAHHTLQLEVIRALHAQKIQLAIGLEMFQADNQQVLDDWVAGKIDEESFVKIYSKNWSFDWRLYRDIFIYARDNRIPVVGLNLPKEIVNRVSKQGFAGLSQEDKARLPAGIGCEMSPRYLETLNMIYSRLPRRPANLENRLAFFSQAQALRNNGMAESAAGYLKRNPERTMVILAGFWHAVKSGTPTQLAQATKRVPLVILPELPEFNLGNATARDADFLVRP